MLPFEVKVKRFIRKHDLIKRNDRLLVAVSGGPDSLALLHYLVKKREDYGIEVIAAHLDHMIRGEESYQDLLFVETFCKQLQVNCISKRIPILEKLKDSSLGIEGTARDYRYSFLKEVMEETNANRVAFGHHGDDQIETVLMRLTRGTSEKGRAGIPLRRPFFQGEIIRPLLCLEKREIEEYCHFYRLQPRIDESNFSLEYTRNRFRSIVVPFLKEENPHAHDHFQRFSEELLEDEAFLQGLTETAVKEVIKKETDKVIMELSKFENMPLPLQRRGIHLILNYLYNESSSYINSEHTDAIFRLISSSHPSGEIDLPLGLKVYKTYNKCVFTFKPKKIVDTYEFELRENMEVNLPNGYRMKLEKKEFSYSFTKQNMLLLHVKDVHMPLIIRNRKPGDRMKVKGLNGSKKVKDIFIDEKIPKHERDTWPIVVDQTGNILWLPNLKRSIYEPAEAIPSETYYILEYCKQTSSRGQLRNESRY
ncbi:tRNA lysidine(34) synthetase TilS [Bacillus ginsengihumi]|uniref:tRNA(Ile)-lysidine synthase n=1 Tax=Heyndrickxia ginsengihumi TaxID=363870 RepID=A0A0A6V9Z8_9BACI|nr:tRNA lysidine(34) synthetase TilS [Heyndrickxia ginsengihumi]KHD85035.1 tRNA(Ile)-lysidine synthetase [Heyndrickxia ginsengihumi]NEY21138.1 tRNA lysidine(34) synthetase TilS [Heyndrickxia ginsengihumi]